MKKPKHGGYPEPIRKEAAREAWAEKAARDALSISERLQSLQKNITTDRGILQKMMHSYGCDAFLRLTVQAMQDASEDMESIHRKSSESYLSRASQVDEMLETDLDES